MRDSYRRLVGIFIAEVVIVAVLDQLSKLIVRQSIDPSLPIEVIPGFFHLVHWSNTGIAFGLFQEHPEILTVLGFLALVGIPLLYWWECKRDPRLSSTVWGLGLIVGGALGNLIDRLMQGHVTDFLLFSIGERSWPAFNVADSAITVGTLLVLYLAYRVGPDEKTEGAESTEPAATTTDKSEGVE